MKTRTTFLFLVVLLIILTPSSVLPAEPAKPIQIKDNLYSIDFIDDTHGWAVGYYGRILHTTDGGKTWVHQKSGKERSLASVDFIDRNNGWVVGYGPTILHTADGGKTWSEQKSEEDVFLTAVRFIDEKKGWAVGEWGTILYTENGGKNWQPQLTGDDAILYDVDFSDEVHGWAVGEFGTIFHTEDGGKIWEKQPSGVANVFFSCRALGSNEVWVVGIDSIVLHSRDGGETWEKVDTGTKKIVPFYEINFDDQKRGIISGQGLAMFTEDGGGSWSYCRADNNIDYIWLYDVAYTHSGTVWMVGERGRIFKSVTNGKEWEERYHQYCPVKDISKRITD